MLHLHCATPGEWGGLAAQHIDEILVDHAHLEKKAASTALTLMFRYPEHGQLLQPLSELAREELRHFELVLSELQHRGGELRKIKPSPYAGKLMTAVRTTEPDRLLDTLLCCAFIEARSCERMKLLAEWLSEGRLRSMYAGLLASEARHHMLYLDLAQTVFDPETVREHRIRIGGWEAQVVGGLPVVPRLHGGWHTQASDLRPAVRDDPHPSSPA